MKVMETPKRESFYTAKRAERQIKFRAKKNFVPALILTLFSWIGIVLLILFANPEILFVKFAFSFFIFLGVGVTTSLILGNSRRGITLGVASSAVILLRLFDLDSIFNTLLITGICLAMEIYFLKR